MVKRQMPIAGFYVSPPCKVVDIHGNTTINGGSIVYTTGQRGGGGHKYIRFDLDNNRDVPSNIDDWPTLLWSCVPGKKEIADMIRAPSIQEAVKIYNSGIIRIYNGWKQPYGTDKLPTNPDPIKIV